VEHKAFKNHFAKKKSYSIPDKKGKRQKNFFSGRSKNTFYPILGCYEMVCQEGLVKGYFSKNNQIYTEVALTVK